MSNTPEAKRPPVTTAKESLREVDRRRSQRLVISVPIRAEGIDGDGEKFVEDTRTILIDRHGARIHLRRKVSAGAILSITSTVARRTGKFRVVGPTQPPSSGGGEWGIERQESTPNIWGVGFPPPSSEAMCPARLECRRCHEVSLIDLSMIEHEVLGLSGLLVRECEVCKRSTSWSYKEPAVKVTGDAAGIALPSPDTVSELPLQTGRRSHGRVALHLPVRVRGFRGTEEFTRTENVSRGGLCFISDRNYEVGEVILVICPYEKTGHHIEVRAQIVQRREASGGGRKIYGVAYER